MQFVYIVCQVESCQNSRPLTFTSYKSRYLSLFYFINWPNLIVSLPLIRGMSGNMCVVIVCQPGCDVISFEIIFQSGRFFYMTKNSKQNVINYVITESFIEQLAEKHVSLSKFGSETNINELKQAVKQWLKHACDCFVEYIVRSCSHIKEFCFESSFIYNTYTYNFVNIVFSTIKTCMIYQKQKDMGLYFIQQFYVISFDLHFLICHRIVLWKLKS